MNRMLLFGFAFWGVFVPVLAQNASNPFELLHRLPKEVATTVGEGVSAGLSNPFDVVPHQPPAQVLVLERASSEVIRPFAVLPQGGGLSGGLLAALLLAAFTFLTFSVANNRSAVGKAWAGFLNDNGFTVAQREASGFIGTTPYYLLYINFLFNAGIFVFLVTRVFQKETYNNLYFLLFCLLASVVAFLSKHVMIAFVRNLFPVEAEMRKYNFLIIIFNCVLGLFLVPFNLLIAFSTKGSHQLLLVSWMLGVVAIFYAYRSLRASTIGVKFLGQSPFHFLLYLCAVEIAPVFLLLKLALMQAV